MPYVFFERMGEASNLSQTVNKRLRKATVKGSAAMDTRKRVVKLPATSPLTTQAIQPGTLDVKGSASLDKRKRVQKLTPPTSPLPTKFIIPGTQDDDNVVTVLTGIMKKK
jgi:hypothetical protein